MTSPLGRLTPVVPPHYQDKFAEVIRREKPNIVVETGVWEGLSAEYILKALDDNGKGHLYSIDPMDATQEFNGTRGNPALFVNNPIVHPRFTLIRKYSQVALEPLFEEIGPFDVFLHDSDHAEAVQTFEYEAAWRYVRSGGIIASDDVAWGMPPHRAWWKFRARHGVPDSADVVIGNARYFRKP